MLDDRYFPDLEKKFAKPKSWPSGVPTVLEVPLLAHSMILGLI